jgi:hypothetical protein
MQRPAESVQAIRGTRRKAKEVNTLKSSMFFSEEKNQKTFLSVLAEASRPWPDSGEAAENVRVFWFFFSKKNFFSPSLLERPPLVGVTAHQ